LAQAVSLAVDMHEQVVPASGTYHLQTAIAGQTFGSLVPVQDGPVLVDVINTVKEVVDNFLE
jgi:hypothetical protein